MYGYIKAAGSKFEHRIDLFARDIELLHHLLHRHSVFQVFKDGGYRQARAPKNPGATYFAGNAFHGRALRPIESHIVLLNHMVAAFPKAFNAWMIQSDLMFACHSGAACEKLNYQFPNIIYDTFSRYCRPSRLLSSQ